MRVSTQPESSHSASRRFTAGSWALRDSGNRSLAARVRRRSAGSANGPRSSHRSAPSRDRESRDQSYTLGDARSLLTLLLYLDEDFEGGETEFPEQGETIAPRAGNALWLQHAVLHAGKPVTRGTKHLLRTDVLYR